MVEDQSAQHAGHAAMRAATAAGKAGSSGETHFRVEVVSEAFTGQNLVQRQRTVYKVRRIDWYSVKFSALVPLLGRPAVTIKPCTYSYLRRGN